MKIHDRNIEWRRARKYIPFAQWAMGGIGGGSATALISSSALYGNKITAAGTAVEGAFRLPYDVDPEFEIGIRVHYAGDGTTPEAVGTLSFIALMKFLKISEAPVAAAAGALDTVIATTAAVSATDNQLEWTARGIKNKGFLGRSDIDDGAICQFSIELDAVGGAINNTNFILVLGVEIDYMPRRTRFPHSEVDGPLDSAMS